MDMMFVKSNMTGAPIAFFRIAMGIFICFLVGIIIAFVVMSRIFHK